MNKPQPMSAGSNAGVVILIAILVLAVPCVAGLVLFGAGMYWVRSEVQIAPPPPPVMVAPVQEVAPQPVIEPESAPPAEASETSEFSAPPPSL
jgi:hypothetical protein